MSETQLLVLDGSRVGKEEGKRRGKNCLSFESSPYLLGDIIIKRKKVLVYPGTFCATYYIGGSRSGSSSLNSAEHIHTNRLLISSTE
jgi:hypothetical protein